VGGLGESNDFSGNTLLPGIRVHNDGQSYAYIRNNATWKNFGVPYILTDDLYVEGPLSPVLTIAPGCSLQFNTGFALLVGNGSSSSSGALIADGTADSIIVFTSSAGSPAPGAWDGVTIGQYASQTQNLLDYCVIDYGVNGLTVNTKPIAVTNCILRNNSGYGVSCSYTGFTAFAGNTVTDNANYPMTIGVNNVGSLGADNNFSGNTVPGIRVHGDGQSTARITTSATWLNHGTPYIMFYETRVGAASNITLTIAPGCSLKFNSGIGLQVGNGSTAAENATLVAEGTADSHIVFTSSSQSPTAGAWDGIILGNDINDGATVMDYCVVEYGGANAQANIYCTNSSPTISNCTITNSSYYGIKAPAPGSNPIISAITYLNNARGDFLGQ